MFTYVRTRYSNLASEYFLMVNLVSGMTYMKYVCKTAIATT